MADSKILEEIGKKSQEIMHSNQELAEKLKRNQDIISRFSDELESLREDMSGEGIKPSTKKELEKIKSDLEEKKSLISDMIDDLKPIEVDITRREDTIDALQQRIKDQEKKIESLSHDLLKHKEQVQRLSEDNTSLKKSLTEKDAMLQVTKNKLTENAAALRESEQAKNRLQEDINSQKKDIFMFRNRIGALEKRIHSTDEQNQKILYEMVKLKQRLKEAEDELVQKSRLLESKDEELHRSVESLKKEEEEKRLMIMKNHAKKVAVMNAAIASLKTKLENHRDIIQEKSRKEQALITEFNNRMRDLMSARADLAADTGEDIEVDTSIPDEEPAKEQPMFSVPKPAEEVSGKTPSLGLDEFDTGTAGPSRMDEIIPMIELAHDHGDSKDQIRHSLSSSGYSSKDIDEAFSKLNLS